MAAITLSGNGKQRLAQFYTHKMNYHLRNSYTIHKLNKNLSAEPTGACLSQN